MATMAESWITYSISRPYPYRWITPLVVVGGIVLLVLFSFLNFVSSGFYLRYGIVLSNLGPDCLSINTAYNMLLIQTPR